MVGQTETEKVEGADKKSRVRSTIGFPYMDLKSAMDMAVAIHANVGHGDCQDDQLAAWTNQSGKSSTFRVQVYASRMFGLLEGESGAHRLTQLGRRIIDPNQERAAKVDAFLTVPLYSALAEKYKGGTLPPTAALERELVALGVSDKQKDRARQVFERAAEQAGFFEQGKNRLVQPGVSRQPDGTPPPPPPPPPPPGGGGSGGGGGGVTGDILIDALLTKLPKSGAQWGVDERVAWLNLMVMGFQMSYGVETTIEVKKA